MEGTPERYSIICIQRRVLGIISGLQVVEKQTHPSLVNEVAVIIDGTF